MFVHKFEVDSEVCGPGVTRKILGRGGTMMMVEVTFEKGAIGPNHTHPHEQVTYVAQGSFQFTIEDEQKIIKRGDSVYIPSMAEHGCIALEGESILVDIFTPQREDFLK
ncbi:MAG: cupin domain-containing protein [Bacillota bacterium]